MTIHACDLLVVYSYLAISLLELKPKGGILNSKCECVSCDFAEVSVSDGTSEVMTSISKATGPNPVCVSVC